MAAETIPVRDAHRFDEGKLGEWLRGQSLGTLTRVTQFPGGQSNPTFLLETSEGERVLRKQPPGKLLPSAHAVDREARVLTALGKAGIPVPVVHGFCESKDVIGTPFYVMERKRGRIFRRNDLPELEKDQRRGIFAGMAKALAALHALDPSAIGLGDYGKTGGYYARQIATWTRQWEASKTRESPALAALVEWLPANLPGDDDVRISHGDYRLENVMFDATEPRVIAIFDWELSTLGPPLADLGYNVLPWYLPPIPPLMGFAGVDLAAKGLPSRDEHVKSYSPNAQLKAFHVAFAAFRIAAILEGVLARAKMGNASAADAEAFGSLGTLFAERGWAIAKEGL